MGVKFYLNLLILCATLFLEISASLEDSTKNSSNLHIRKKRLIDNSLGGNRPVSIEQIPYIVDIHKGEERHCGGSILSPTIILTAAHCIMQNLPYRVISGSGRANHGIRHNVTRKILNQWFLTSKYTSDLAMLKIFPPIDLIHSPNRKIILHNGNIRPNSLGTVSGWGCIHKSPTSIIYPDELRAITVPLIGSLECQNLYRGYAPITSKNICTFDREGLKGCCKGDSGGPLVVDGRLLGVNIWGREELRTPDVFVNVAEPHHATWISVSMRKLNGEF